jgi:hypothetical protein
MTAGPPVVYIQICVSDGIDEKIGAHQSIMKETWYSGDDTDDRERDAEVLIDKLSALRHFRRVQTDLQKVQVSSGQVSSNNLKFRAANSHFSSCLYPVWHSRIRWSC